MNNVSNRAVDILRHFALGREKRGKSLLKIGIGLPQHKCHVTCSSVFMLWFERRLPCWSEIGQLCFDGLDFQPQRLAGSKCQFDDTRWRICDNETDRQKREDIVGVTPVDARDLDFADTVEKQRCAAAFEATAALAVGRQFPDKAIDGENKFFLGCQIFNITPPSEQNPGDARKEFAGLPHQVR